MNKYLTNIKKYVENIKKQPLGNTPTHLRSSLRGRIEVTRLSNFLMVLVLSENNRKSEMTRL